MAVLFFNIFYITPYFLPIAANRSMPRSTHIIFNVLEKNLAQLFNTTRSSQSPGKNFIFFFSLSLFQIHPWVSIQGKAKRPSKALELSYFLNFVLLTVWIPESKKKFTTAKHFTHFVRSLAPWSLSTRILLPTHGIKSLRGVARCRYFNFIFQHTWYANGNRWSNLTKLNFSVSSIANSKETKNIVLQFADLWFSVVEPDFIVLA